MIWDHYIPLAVSGSTVNKQAGQQSSTILDFAGINPQRLIGEVEGIIEDCVSSGAKHLLVNIDGTSLMSLVETFRNSVPAPIGGAVPMRLGSGAQTLVPHSTGLLIDAGECFVVDTSSYQAQISGHLGRFIGDLLIDSTVGDRGESDHHFITAGGAHIPTWYRLGPLLELEGFAELLGFHLSKQLQGTSIDLIIPSAEPGIQLAIRLASRLSADVDEGVGYVVPVKDSLTGGRPEISDLDEETVRGKRVLLLIDVLCAGETIRRLADEVDRCGGYVRAVAGILNFERSRPLQNALDSIESQNRVRVAEWTWQRESGLPHPPYFVGPRWLSEVPDPVYPDAGQCRDCNRGKPYALLWSSAGRRAVVSSVADEVEMDSRLPRSPVSWSQFWLGAQKVRGIGQVELKVACNHCHDGQVLDVSRLREASNLWDDITQWAGLEIENGIKSRSPADTDPIYLVTSQSRGSTILAGELVRQYEQLQGPHIVTRNPHTRRWGSRESTLPSGRKCILIDDQVFNTDTITGMLTYAERSGCQVVGILSILYCARGDDHYELVRTLKERGIPFSAAYVAALQWADKSRCGSHADFEVVKTLAGWPGWSSQLGQWFEASVSASQKHLESTDTSARADLLIGRMFRRRQREWDRHLIGRFSEEELSMWTQVVADWNDPEGSFDLGPEFAVAAADFGASLDPTSAVRMLRQLLQETPVHRMALAISDLIDSLPLDLCTQQHENLVELFDQHRRHRIAAGKTPVDQVTVALFKALWDVNLDKERWLHDVLTEGTESEFPLYGSVLATVMVGQRTPGEIRTSIRRLQALRDQQSGATAGRPPKVSSPFLELALRDLDHYRRFLEHQAGRNGNEVAILTSSSDEISVRDVDPASEGHLAANTILIDFSTSRLIIGGQHIPTKKRHGFDTLMSLAGLVCLHPPGMEVTLGGESTGPRPVTTSSFRRFLEPRHELADPSSSARQALLTLRKRLGNSGPFLFQKAPGSTKSPWTVRVKDGWKWVILDSPAQNNLVSLRAFVQGPKTDFGR